MIAVILLATALAMDAFAVAISLGAKQLSENSKPRSQPQQSSTGLLRLAIYAALYFGIAQGVMPLIGYVLGVAMLGWLAGIAPWIGGMILIGLGAKMLYEINTARHNAPDNLSDNDNVAGSINNDRPKKISHRTLLTLAVATSIDAMAAGFSLNLLSVKAWLACLIIAVITAIFSFAGVYLGKHSGDYFEEKAEALGGTVLVLIGLKVMLF